MQILSSFLLNKKVALMASADGVVILLSFLMAQSVLDLGAITQWPWWYYLVPVSLILALSNLVGFYRIAVLRLENLEYWRVGWVIPLATFLSFVFVIGVGVTPRAEIGPGLFWAGCLVFILGSRLAGYLVLRHELASPRRDAPYNNHRDKSPEAEIEQLLGRPAIPPDLALMTKRIYGKQVMVTGAGGSIGSELCRQIVQTRPLTLVLYELTEFALYSIERDLLQLVREKNLDVTIVPVLGSVQDQDRLGAIMRHYKVQTVYHAAAYKHVPLVEYNVIEGVKNNVLGTKACADAAIYAGVELFVLVSTDKAVRPTNVMGASKRMAEMVLQAHASDPAVATRFCMVRFGNVLGSSGSVVPLFKRQIAQGGPVLVTHPEINRFFMTVTEAAQLVIQAGAMGGAGEVFVLDMGAPVKIVDLAHRMITLSGLSVKSAAHPQGDIEIRYSGLRPGEKLYEELLIGAESLETEHPRIAKARETFMDKRQMGHLTTTLAMACKLNDVQRVIDLLCQKEVDFSPAKVVRDHLFARGPARVYPGTGLPAVPRHPQQIKQH